ncbi:MAG TPA: NUDIX hydrolase [Nevskiaceae bacterium]|nr:NUDIX hydrolase [Nevskiaceae bacterium]
MNGFSPHVVLACVVERGGRFLMVEEAINGQHVFNQPAGHWEPGETLFEGAVREVREETGWRVRLSGFIGVYEWQPETLPYPFLRLCFAAEALGAEPAAVLDSGIIAAHWLRHEEIVALGPRLRSPAVLRSLEDYRAGQVHSLNLVRHLSPPLASRPLP